MNDYRQATAPLSAFFTRVFGWMAIGLATTAATAWYISFYHPEILFRVMESPLLYILLFVAQLGLVFMLSAKITSLSLSTAASMFMLYALLTGVNFSVIFLSYTSESIFSTFVVAAGLFLTMALFGMLTRFNLAPWGMWIEMMLFGIIIALLVNWFFQSSTFNLIISLLGVVLFSAATAYDMQRLTWLSREVEESSASHVALLGALMLYLDFINLFVMLISLTGKRRD